MTPFTVVFMSMHTFVITDQCCVGSIMEVLYIYLSFSVFFFKMSKQVFPCMCKYKVCHFCVTQIIFITLSKVSSHVFVSACNKVSPLHRFY